MFFKLPRHVTCRLLFENAEATFFLRRLPFDHLYGPDQVWKKFQKKCLEFISNAGNKSEDNRASVNRGHNIHLASPPQPFADESTLSDIDGSRTNRHNERDGVRGSSLTFFAITCATLAIGAIHTPIQNDESS